MTTMRRRVDRIGGLVLNGANDAPSAARWSQPFTIVRGADIPPAHQTDLYGRQGPTAISIISR